MKKKNRKNIKTSKAVSYEDMEQLKKECAKALRKAGHKAFNINQRMSAPRQSFNKIDETKYRVIDKKISGDYEEWLETHTFTDGDGFYKEPLEANPDLFEQND